MAEEVTDLAAVRAVRDRRAVLSASSNGASARPSLDDVVRGIIDVLGAMERDSQRRDAQIARAGDAV